MSYGYKSDTAFSKAVTNIKNKAEALLDRLNGNRGQKEKTRPILFVTHSLGGIVVKKAGSDINPLYPTPAAPYPPKHHS
jgi:hypothetical protein